MTTTTPWMRGSRLKSMARFYCDVEDTDSSALRTGVIAFGMSTGTLVEFKDIRLKRLKSNP